MFCPPFFPRVGTRIRIPSPSRRLSPMAASSSWVTAHAVASRSAPTTCSATPATSLSRWSRQRHAISSPGDGLQQAKDYAEILGLKFAYATNGHGIVEFDYLTGHGAALDAFPTPDELWARFRAGAGLDRWPRPTPCSRPPTTSAARPPATTRRSPSTAPCRPSSRASSGSC